MAELTLVRLASCASRSQNGGYRQPMMTVAGSGDVTMAFPSSKETRWGGLLMGEAECVPLVAERWCHRDISEQCDATLKAESLGEIDWVRQKSQSVQACGQRHKVHRGSLQPVHLTWLRKPDRAWGCMRGVLIASVVSSRHLIASGFFINHHKCILTWQTLKQKLLLWFLHSRTFTLVYLCPVPKTNDPFYVSLYDVFNEHAFEFSACVISARRPLTGETLGFSDLMKNTICTRISPFSIYLTF